MAKIIPRIFRIMGQWLPLSCGTFSCRHPLRVMREESLAAVLSLAGNAGNG
jgi:hypothetical protein